MHKTLAQGRFQVQGKLGQGAQGVVYAALDTRLSRKVAIKLLHSQGEDALNEARVVGQLQHPHVVPLFDAFMDNGHPCLVFEYVEGQTLAARMAGSGSWQASDAISLLLPVIDGVAQAHARGLVHRDIKPQNILLDAAGRARLTDFGVARARGSQGDELAGTAGYLPPEVLAAVPVDAQADVFALGVVLYQMLCARLPADGATALALLHNTLLQPFVPPSHWHGELDEELDQIVMVALCKDPQQRYRDAAELHAALTQWLSQSAQHAEGAAHSTLEFLLRRMHNSGDFPALSQTISAINRIDDADNERLQSLSEVILKDFSLTNRLLRMVNSASYGQFGGTINTVSRAIVILGFDNIRALAITLLLFEHLHNQSQARRLRDAVLQALFCGLLARNAGRKCGWRDAETLMICGMFQYLGRLLVLYYFAEEGQEIQRRVDQGMDEVNAATAVLGISYRDLGHGVARSWNFPEAMLASMRALPEGTLREAQTMGERLRQLANLAFDLQPLVAASPTRAAQLQAVERRFAPVSELRARDLDQLLQDSARDCLDYLSLLGVNPRDSAFSDDLGRLLGRPVSNAPAASEAGAAASVAHDSAAPAQVPAQVLSMLTAGVQDITNTLVGKFNLNDLLRMILETMYRSVGFDRVLFCTRDARSGRMQARFGFGDGVGELVPRFSFELHGVHDVFQLCMNRNADVLIEDISAEAIAARVPQWFRKVSSAQTFIVLPLVIDGKPIGLFYGEREQAHSLHIPHEQLGLLKTMRNQAILAVRQKQAGG